MHLKKSSGHLFPVRITSNVLQFHDSWIFQLPDLLLDHHLKGLVVDEAWQFPPAVPVLVVAHLSFNFPVNWIPKNLCIKKQRKAMHEGQKHTAHSFSWVFQESFPFSKIFPQRREDVEPLSTLEFLSFGQTDDILTELCHFR